MHVFRPFATDHPALFEFAFRGRGTDRSAGVGFRAEANEALASLHRLVARLQPSRELGSLSVAEAVIAFDALCEGLAHLEAHSTILADDPETQWRHALTALVHGFALPSRVAEPP